MRRLLLCLLCPFTGPACDAVAPEDPYADWPVAEQTFPYVVTPETDLAPYEEVRWETETWDPFVDQALAAAYLVKASQHRQGAPVEVEQHFAAQRSVIPPLTDGTGLVRLSFVGDVMWLGTSWDNFALPVAELIDGDLRIGNLETPVVPGDTTELDELGLYTFNSPPAILDGLPLDLLQGTNNHSLDRGDAGLAATTQEVRSRGYLWTGVDEHAFVTIRGLTVAFLAFTWGLNGRGPSAEHELFVVPFGHLDAGPLDLGAVEGAIVGARAEGADFVVVMPHWGFEYEYFPDPWFMQIGRAMVAMGADLVVGHGPHVVQPVERCFVNTPTEVPGVATCSVQGEGPPREAAIVYSLGNFDTVQPTIPAQTGLVLTADLDDGGVRGLGWRAIATVPGGDGRQLRPLDELAAEGGAWNIESGRLAAHLGAGWRR